MSDTKHLWDEAVALQKQQDADNAFKVLTEVPVADPASGDPSLSRLEDKAHIQELLDRREKRRLQNAISKSLEEADTSLSNEKKSYIIQRTVEHYEEG